MKKVKTITIGLFFAAIIACNLLINNNTNANGALLCLENLFSITNAQAEWGEGPGCVVCGFDPDGCQYCTDNNTEPGGEGPVNGEACYFYDGSFAYYARDCEWTVAGECTPEPCWS